MISSLEIETTLGSANAAISPRVRRLTLSSLNTSWLGAALSGSLVLIGSTCFADLPAEVATVLMKTVGAAVFGAVASFTLVAVLLCCCGTGGGMSLLMVCSQSSCYTVSLETAPVPQHSALALCTHIHSNLDQKDW